MLLRALIEDRKDKGKEADVTKLRAWLKTKSPEQKKAMRNSDQLRPIVQRLEAEDAAKTAQSGGQGSILSFFPDVGSAWMPVITFFVYVGVNWWATWYPGSEPGGGGYVAPAQRLVDFVRGADSRDLPERSSYRPGLVPGRIDRLLPTRIVKALQEGARQADRQQLRGYLSREAVVVGVETTTSSPVRIPRGADRQSVSHPGLYPCAEGAGYAGGIVSSAIEGYESAHAVLGIL